MVSSRANKILVAALVSCIASALLAANNSRRAVQNTAPAKTPSATAAGRNAARATQPVSLEAASSDVDYKSNTVTFRDISITQGDLHVTAESARATGLDFEKSTWSFRGTVRIAVEGGKLQSNEAVVTFADNKISKAIITGSPAQFEQQRKGSSEIARGRADNINYDVLAGVLRLTTGAWLSDGRNEISGRELVYNVREQHVQAQSAPGDTDRVRITIRPRDPETPVKKP